jgi:pantothenate kinase
LFLRGAADFVDEMSETLKIKVIRRDEAVQVHEDLKRLVKSMQMVLIRKYKDPEERRIVAIRIMAEVRAVA